MFEKYIGQDHIKDLLTTFIAYSKSSTEPLQHMLITGGSGLGKALPLNTLILTNNGFVKNKDIKVGDYVIDPFGKQVKVLGVYPQGIRQCYKLTFIDGRTIEADENHLWEIFNRQYDDTPMVFTTAFLYKMMQGRNKMFYKQCRVRLFNGRYGIKKDFIIHPYLLGVLLGDGVLSRGCSWCKPDIEIVEKIKLLIHSDYKINRHDYENKCPIFIIVRKDGKRNDNIYINELRKLNLMNTNSVNKFIPEEYFHCSYEQRLELLRGLLDTDGHITKDGALEYSTSSIVLAKQVQSLVWSLGYRCSVVKRKTRCNGKWFESYRLHIVGEDRNNLFSLKRKQSEHQAQVQIKDLLITKIEKIDKKETQCIYVDSNEHLYIAENYITTHNTTLATTISKELGVKCVSLLATNASEDDLIKAICNLSDKDILFIDEIHALNKKLIEILFPIISEHILYTKYQGVMTRFRVSNFTIIGATTHEGKLPTAFLNRFTVTLNLKPYTESELSTMTKLYLGQYKADGTMLNAIVNMSKGVPRIITNIVNSVKVYLKSLGKDTLEQKDLKMIQMFLGVNDIGLNNVDFEILKYLCKVKAASLKTLASVLSIEAINIEQIHEPYLIKLGFIERNSRGRSITEKGLDYLKQNNI